LSLFKKRKSEDINYLDLTPYRLYGHDLREDGLIDVLVPRFTDKFFGKFLQPSLKKPFIKANFDEIGSAVWLEINGERKVEEIIANLNEMFGDKIHPVFERVTLFLSQLHRNGFIKFHELKKRI
jgi:hypothetical protein